MNIEVKHYKENEDGTADVIVSTDEEGQKFLLKYGIIAALKDAIKFSEEEYTPKESKEPEKVADNQVVSLQDELQALRDILGAYDEELRQANEQIVKLQREPLPEERVVALYRRSMDWRQFARDIENEHGVKPQKIDISVPEEDGYDE
jgi:hypothetical protein